MHAPHPPSPQANFVPFRPKSLRRNAKRVKSGEGFLISCLLPGNWERCELKIAIMEHLSMNSYRLRTTRECWTLGPLLLIIPPKDD